MTNFTFQNQQTRLMNKQIINFFTKPKVKNETRRGQNHENGFIPDSARTRGEGSSSNITPIRRKPTITWRGESEREESLSDPRWYRGTPKNNLRTLNNSSQDNKPVTYNNKIATRYKRGHTRYTNAKCRFKNLRKTNHTRPDKQPKGQRIKFRR